MASCEERGWYCIRVGGMTSLGVLERVLERVLEHRSTSDEHSVVAAPLWFSVAEARRSKKRIEGATNKATCYTAIWQWGRAAQGEGLRRRDRWEEDCQGAQGGVHVVAVRET